MDNYCEKQVAFQHLCEDYASLTERQMLGRQKLEEAIGSTQFKLEEASAIVESMQSEHNEFENQLIPAMVSNCKKLQVLYAKIDLIHVCTLFG